MLYLFQTLCISYDYCHYKVACDFEIPVLFEEKPKDVVILEGETAALSCTISDLTSLVTWRRNHIPLCNGDKYELRKEGKVNVLLIYDVEPLDTGTYCCDTGDVQSSAKLTVTGKNALLEVD